MRPGTDRDSPQPIDRLVPSPQQADIGFLRRSRPWARLRGSRRRRPARRRTRANRSSARTSLSSSHSSVDWSLDRRGRDAHDVAVADQERDHQRVQEHRVDVRRRDVEGEPSRDPDRAGLLERGEAIRQPLDLRAAKPECRPRPSAGTVASEGSCRIALRQRVAEIDPQRVERARRNRGGRRAGRAAASATSTAPTRGTSCSTVTRPQPRARPRRYSRGARPRGRGPGTTPSSRAVRRDSRRRPRRARSPRSGPSGRDSSRAAR